MSFVVREALLEDLPALRAVELQAATRFDSEGIVGGLEKRTVPVQALEVARKAGTLWVASTQAEEVVGFLLAEELDSCLHVSEVSVVPAHGRQGIGAALLEAAAWHARQTGLQRLTLTTFAKVPWNGPYYAKRGFRVMLWSELGAGLAARMKQEAAVGLANRIAMCRE